MRFSLFFICVFNYCLIEAQINADHFLITDSTQKIKIALHNEILINSTGYNNKLLYATFNHRVLSEKDKQHLIKKPLKQHKIGGMSNQSLYIGLNTKQSALFFSVQDKWLLSSILSNDLYTLSIMGNSYFENQLANLGNTSAYMLHYNSFGLGATLFKKQDFYIALQAKFVLASQFYALDLSEGDLFTAPYGAFIDISTVSEERASFSKNYIAANGKGGGIDLFLSKELQFLSSLDSTPAVFKFNLEDLGFIWFNTNANHYKNDTTVSNIRGYNVLGDASFSIADSLWPRIDTLETTTSIFMPILFSTSFEKSIQKHGFKTSLIFLNNQAFSPKVNLIYRYKVSEKISAFATGSFGGFGKPMIGSGVSFSSQNILVSLQIPSLFSQINRRYSAANHGVFNLSLSF